MNATTSPRATVRTYRHGLGDCHLVTLFGAGDATFRMLIDCGVIIGTPDAASKMAAVLDDVLQTTDQSIDLLIATHEHWDHLSGFVQAPEQFGRLKTGSVWMSWIEDPDDKDAQQIKQEHAAALALVQSAALQLDRGPAGDTHPLNALLGFFGVAGRATTAEALEAVRGKVEKPRYCAPADGPVDVPGVEAKIYVLGPPRDMKMLRKTQPSNAAPETYSLAAATLANAAYAFGDDAAIPFGNAWRIPNDVGRQQAFFQRQYWSGGDWRRIDTDYLGGATALAIALDNMTNNTSLVLAIELSGGDVLLFAADAQVGNWLSWSGCSWNVGGGAVSGNDLLQRTVFYKVGHHGSPNATLKEHGVQLMRNLRYATIPVDHDMAVKKGWGKLPLPSLVEALEAAIQGRGRVLRTDQDPAATGPVNNVKVTPLYFEVAL
jgi:hypothetical protein